MDTLIGTRSFPAEATHLHRVRTLIREQADQAALSSDVTGDLLIAVSEACANSALHTDCAELTVRWAGRRLVRPRRLRSSRSRVPPASRRQHTKHVRKSTCRGRFGLARQSAPEEASA